MLHEAALGRPSTLALRLTPLSISGEPSGFLAVLETSERDTGVELRVSALFDRAGVENRASLLAQVLRAA